MTPGIKLQLEITAHEGDALELRALLGVEQLIGVQARTDIVLMIVKGLLESIVAPHGAQRLGRNQAP